MTRNSKSCGCGRKNPSRAGYRPEGVGHTARHRAGLGLGFRCLRGYRPSLRLDIRDVCNNLSGGTGAGRGFKSRKPYEAEPGRVNLSRIILVLGSSFLFSALGQKASQPASGWVECHLPRGSPGVSVQAQLPKLAKITLVRPLRRPQVHPNLLAHQV